MDPNTGHIYDSRAIAITAGVRDAVEITGTPAAIESISRAVRAQQKARRKAQKKARRSNRG